MDILDHRISRYLIGVVLIVLGVLFLLGELVDFRVGTPFFIVVPGIALLAIGIFGVKRLAFFTVFGSIVTATGVILFFQTFSLNFLDKWAYLWAVYPTLIGFSMVWMAYRNQQSVTRLVGLRLGLTGAIALLSLGALFELYIFREYSRSSLNNVLALLLILVGVVFFVVDRIPLVRRWFTDEDENGRAPRFSVIRHRPEETPDPEPQPAPVSETEPETQPAPPATE